MSLSSRRGESDSSTYDLVNPGGRGGNCLCVMANLPELPVPSGSNTPGLSGVCVVVDSFFQGSGSSGGPVFSIGFSEGVGFSSAMRSMEIPSRPSVLMRYIRHRQRSWTPPQSLPRGPPDCMVHLWRALTSTTISSCLTSLMSRQPWNGRGKTSPHFNPARQGRVFHHPLFSGWALGSCQATACLLARSCTSFLLRILASMWQKNQNAHHQFGISSLFLMYTQTHTIVLLG